MGCHYKCLFFTRISFYLSTIAIHAANIIVMLSGFNEDTMKIPGVKDLYQTQFYYFTSWNMGFQIAYAAFALFCDWINLGYITAEKKPTFVQSLSSLREKIFTVTVWPSTLLVTTYFWSFYAYDRNLLYPEYFDAVVSHTSNHIMHTLILPIAVTELVLNPRKKPESSAARVCFILCLAAVYVCVLYYTHSTTGIWIYPIFAKLNKCAFGLVSFVGVSALYMIVLYYGQFCVSKTILRCWEMIGKKICRPCRK